MRRADLMAVGRILALAFVDDPFYAALFPDPQARARILPAYFELSAAEALDLDAAYVAESPVRRVAGAALWAPPATPGRVTPPRTRNRVLAERFGAPAFGTYAAVMDHLRDRRLASVPSGHWYLNLLGVHPSMHGRGLGGSLVQSMLGRADREDRITALETFAESNIPLYARYGFRVVHAGREPRAGLRWWLMARGPQGNPQVLGSP